MESDGGRGGGMRGEMERWRGGEMERWREGEKERGKKWSEICACMRVYVCMPIERTALVTCPRFAHAKDIRGRLVPPHRMRNLLMVVTTVTLVCEGVLHPECTGFTTTLVNQHFVWLSAQRAPKN